MNYIAILVPKSEGVNELLSDAKKNNLLIDATAGNKVKSVIIADTKHVIISDLIPIEAKDKYLFM